MLVEPLPESTQQDPASSRSTCAIQHACRQLHATATFDQHVLCSWQCTSHLLPPTQPAPGMGPTCSCAPHMPTWLRPAPDAAAAHCPGLALPAVLPAVQLCNLDDPSCYTPSSSCAPRRPSWSSDVQWSVAPGLVYMLEGHRHAGGAPTPIHSKDLCTAGRLDCKFSPTPFIDLALILYSYQACVVHQLGCNQCN